ncbi:MAG TPA: helix-turn-helix transcriptional regulator [Dysgonamonadaceae bacterium]|mgnify:CR=1 FL=1|jgi:transcriptional regulator with XRE-family HTH domain|nr:helix-turn-helix transcriptional regulator [Dysgonamonadaceae bacterium]
MLKEQIGKRVRDLRVTKANMNQDEFSKIIGVDRTYLSRLESGKQNITIENLNTICNGLQITLKEFFDCFDNKYSEE